RPMKRRWPHHVYSTFRRDDRIFRVQSKVASEINKCMYLVMCTKRLGKVVKVTDHCGHELRDVPSKMPKPYQEELYSRRHPLASIDQTTRNLESIWEKVPARCPSQPSAL